VGINTRFPTNQNTSPGTSIKHLFDVSLGINQCHIYAMTQLTASIAPPTTIIAFVRGRKPESKNALFMGVC
jgi:hypothetical protein